MLLLAAGGWQFLRNRSGPVSRLTAGQVLRREIAAERPHRYTASLQAGELLRVEVEQSGADIALEVHDPQGAKLTEADSPNEEWGPELLLFAAPQTGVYKISVVASQTNAPHPTYSLRVKEIRLADSSDRLRLQAQKEFSAGVEHFYEFEFQAAAPRLEKARELWNATGEVSRQALTLDLLAQSYYNLANIGAARRIIDEALSLIGPLREERQHARLLNVSGGIFEVADEKQRALQAYKQALAINRRLGVLSGTIAALNNVGGVYRAIGEYAAAADYYLEAGANARQANGYEELEAPILSNLGAMHAALGDYPKALDFQKQSIAIRVKLKHTPEEAISRNLLGELYLRMGQNESASVELQKALAIFRSQKDARRQAAALANIGLLQVQKGDFSAAAESYAQALAMAVSARDVREQLLILSRLAQCENRRGNLNAALRYSRQAVERIEASREQIEAPDFRASLLASLRDVYEEHVDILMQAHKRSPGNGFARQALEASESARARSLLESLPAVAQAIRRDLPAPLRQRQSELQNQLRQKARQASQGEISKLVAELRGIDGEIRASSPRYASLNLPRPVSVKALQNRLLDPDTIVLEYLLGGQRSYAWMLSRSTLQVAELPAAEHIESLAARLLGLASKPPAQLSPSQRQEYDTVAQSLSDILLGQFPVIRARRLLIVADGSLHLIPFPALPRKADSGALQPLLAQHEVIVLPSASVLSLLREEAAARKPAPKKLAVLADPVFDPKDSRVARSARLLQRSAIDSARPPERLAFARDEAKAILSLVGESDALPALDFQASRATALSGELQRYQVLHFATHGILNSQHPELSGLVLSLVDDRGRPQDGFLRLVDIYGLRLAADLVVLSACRTAIGKNVKGEGLQGLARGFMYAGTPRVIASLWRVDDQATSELMKRFYTAMLGPAKQSPSTALRQAQLALWATPRWQSPYYWAAFQFHGEWR